MSEKSNIDIRGDRHKDISLGIFEEILLNEKEKKVIVVLRENDKENAKKRLKILEKKYNGYKIKIITPLNILKGNSLKEMIKAKDLSGKLFSEKIGLHERYIVEYNLRNLNHSEKTMFGYALKGRDGKSGIISEIGGKVVGRNAIDISNNSSEKIVSFMEYWKISFKAKSIWVENNENDVTDTLLRKKLTK